ncbi:hypothetical protein AGMMS49546_29820 [Spirochaetia bacterium]|nr:hypothetical protein AGMMS49546_29820 [Spirochaetia bacterium]
MAETEAPSAPTGKIFSVAIEDEVKNDYLSYAMSGIVARALPDMRDGLKPVHRRILYSMDDLGLRPNAATKKSARIVGDTMGKYHPHGDLSLYDAMVRMAQDFSLRYPVVQSQGNFGSLDGDPPAAMRYTEAKLSRVGDELLQDLGKDTVDFVPNYDESLKEPSVLPSGVPNLLVNGSSGIAVGMATNMAPHNLTEICAAVCAFIDNPDITIDELMQHVSGPDFPTGGIFFGRRGIREAYQTGRGKLLVRGRFVVETTKSGKETIIFTEIPYNVNKALVLQRIGELVRDKVIEGIAYSNDESDRDGIRIIIELKKGAFLKVVLNQLFSNTQLQTTFGIINLALVKGRPQTLNLKELIHYFVEHRVEVVTRRTRYELRKAEERAHILQGLVIALANIDEVVLVSRKGQALRTHENTIRAMGRSGHGVSGMKLDDDDELTGLLRVVEKETMMLVSEYGYGKRVDFSEFTSHGRRSKGQKIYTISEKTGELVGCVNVLDTEEIMCITRAGKSIKLNAEGIRVMGRGAQGVRILSIDKSDFVIGVDRVVKEDMPKISAKEGDVPGNEK